MNQNNLNTDARAVAGAWHAKALGSIPRGINWTWWVHARNLSTQEGSEFKAVFMSLRLAWATWDLVCVKVCVWFS